MVRTFLVCSSWNIPELQTKKVRNMGTLSMTRHLVESQENFFKSSV